jgi:hypothetical protein
MDTNEDLALHGVPVAIHPRLPYVRDGIEHHHIHMGIIVFVSPALVDQMREADRQIDEAKQMNENVRANAQVAEAEGGGVPVSRSGTPID